MTRIHKQTLKSKVK